MRDLLVVGAGGFARETVEAVRAINAVYPTWKLSACWTTTPTATAAWSAACPSSGRSSTSTASRGRRSCSPPAGRTTTSAGR